MNKILIAGIVGIISLPFTSCEKDPLKNLSASESRIYITNHDSTADFSSFKTFSIADSAGVIENDQGSGKEITMYDAAVINAVKAAMQTRGFQLVDHTASPDLGITVSRVYNSYTGVISYPSYWDYYDSFYDPYYWGYPGYGYYDPIYYGPSYYDYYQITEGALAVDMLNLKDATKDNNTIRPVWSAMARGTGVLNTNNAESEVKAFFDQSPYLLTSQ